MSFTAHAKLTILRILSRLTALRCRLKGVRLGKGCLIDGMPYIRLQKGSKLILGDQVTLISNRRHNPLLEHKVSIRTLTPTAEVILGNQVGMSGSRIVCCNKISIGDYTIIGADTLIYDSEGHDFSPATGWKNRVCYTGRPISIGARCFIGTRCIIMSGVTIGDCSVVSAGTVLKQDLPPGHKAEGNPAKITPLPKILGGPGSSEDLQELTLSCTSASKKQAEHSKAEKNFLREIQDLLELDFSPHMDDRFREYGSWDSLAFISLVAHLKERYNIELTPERFNGVTTWRELYAWTGTATHAATLSGQSPEQLPHEPKNHPPV